MSREFYDPSVWRCGDCHFFRNGECRRFPPVPVGSYGSEVRRLLVIHPTVAPTHGCGEFAPSEATLQRWIHERRETQPVWGQDRREGR